MEPNRHEEIIQLIYRYMEGTIAPEDEERLRQWREEDPENQKLMESLEDPDAGVGIASLAEVLAACRTALVHRLRLPAAAD